MDTLKCSSSTRFFSSPWLQSVAAKCFLPACLPARLMMVFQLWLFRFALFVLSECLYCWLPAVVVHLAAASAMAVAVAVAVAVTVAASIAIILQATFNLICYGNQKDTLQSPTHTAPCWFEQPFASLPLQHTHFAVNLWPSLGLCFNVPEKTYLTLLTANRTVVALNTKILVFVLFQAARTAAFKRKWKFTHSIQLNWTQFPYL